MASPSPADAPKLWGTIVLGTNVFGRQVSDFMIVRAVKVVDELGVDATKGAGKDKAKIRLTGLKPAPVTIELEWGRPAWEAARAFLRAIKPRGPSKGGPFEAKHPELAEHDVQYLQISKVEQADIEPGARWYKATISAMEAEPPRAASAAKGTRTAQEPEKYGQQWSGGGPNPGDQRAGAGSDGKGFEGKEAPKAAP